MKELNNNALTQTTIEVAIRLILFLLLVVLCIAIMLPFINPVLWGAIIAISLAPFYNKIVVWLGGRNKLASALFILFFLLIIIVPSYWLLGSLFDGIAHLGNELRDGTLTIPPPEESVADWPFIGERISNAWQAASDNLRDAIVKYHDQVKKLGTAIMDSALGFSSSLLMFIVSFVIAGILLIYANEADRTFKNLFEKLLGENGKEISQIIVITIRNVAKGILLVGVIQGLLAGIAFALAGVPFAGLWGFLVLFLAIIQLPPLLIGIPVIVYVYSIHDPVVATIWAIVILIISAGDNFLKPMLMGKGAPVPMLVIFIGAIGGFILLGFIGLFTGAIILSLGYKLFIVWLHPDKVEIKDKETK